MLVPALSGRQWIAVLRSLGFRITHLGPEDVELARDDARVRVPLRDHLSEGDVGSIERASGVGQDAICAAAWSAWPDAHALPTTSERLRAAAPISLESFRVLVAEDDADTRELLAYVLGDAGAETHVTNDARAALRLLENVVVDVVVSDIGLPGMDGYELVKAVRARPELRGLPIVALTAWAADIDRRQAERAGFDAFLPKPVHLDDLLRTVQSVVVRKRRRSS